MIQTIDASFEGSNTDAIEVVPQKYDSAEAGENKKNLLNFLRCHYQSDPTEQFSTTVYCSVILQYCEGTSENKAKTTGGTSVSD